MQWCETVMPGWRLVGTRRLRGGLDTAMHALDLSRPGAERRRVVLKRFDPLHTGQDAAASCRRMWQTLAAVERLHLAAPRPVWHDPEGHIFGAAAVVLTWAPGRVRWRLTDPRTWAGRLAETLAAIHRAPLDGIDLSFLPRIDQQVDHDLDHLERDAALVDRHPDGTVIRATLRRLRPAAHRGRAVLNHGDFHAGNVLWRRGRVEAVVDWDHAAVGDPGADVGLARLALTLQHAPAIADDFLRAYEATTGGTAAHLVFWDLLAAALAIRYFDLWVASMGAFGRDDITADELHRRLDSFIADALARA